MALGRTLRVLARVGPLVIAAALSSPVAGQSPGSVVREIPVSSEGFAVRLSPDGHLLAVFEDAALGDDQVVPEQLPIRLIDLATGEQSATLDGFTDYAADVAFSPDGERLASWHLNGELMVWDVSGTQPALRSSFRTAALGRAQIAFMPDGRTVLALVPGTPSFVHLIDIDTGSITHVMGPRFERYADLLEQVRLGPAFNLQDASMAVSPDGATLATASFGGEVAIWAIPDGPPRVLRRASDALKRGAIRQLTFMAGGDSLWYFDDSDGQIHAWDVASGTESGAFGSGGDPFAVFADSAQLAWVEPADDGHTSVGVVDLGGSVAPYSLAVLDGRPVPGTTTIAYTPDGSTIVVGGLRTTDQYNAIHLLAAPW